MKNHLLIFSFFLILSCTKNQESNSEDGILIWQEFSYNTDENIDTLLTFKVIRYLEIHRNGDFKVMKRDSFNSPMKYYKAVLNNEKIEQLFISKNFSALPSESFLDMFGLYCGNTYALKYKTKKEDVLIGYYTIHMTDSLKKINTELNEIINSDALSPTDSFTLIKNEKEIIKKFGHLIEPPKIVSTKFLPPKILEEEK